MPTHASQPYAQRELEPLTTAAEELLALPGTDRVLRATLGQLDGHAGAAELRGMSFTTGVLSHQRAPGGASHQRTRADFLVVTKL